MLLDVPGKFGGDVGDEVTAGSQTMIMASHAKLTVLERTANKLSSGREHFAQVSMVQFSTVNSQANYYILH